MNCDRVFDLLTSPTAPADEDGSVIESHLGQCQECRELADGIGPATILLRHDAAEDEAAEDLVPFGPAAEGDRKATAARKQDGANVGGVRRSSPSPLVGNKWIACLAAALFVGVLLGVTFERIKDATRNSVGLGLSFPIEDGGATPASPIAQEKAVRFAKGMRTSLQLPSACRVLDTQGHAPTCTFICCTTCHAAGSGQKVRAPVSRLARACQSCHTNNKDEG